MLVLVLMSMLMTHTSLHFLVLSFVLACGYVASEDRAVKFDVKTWMKTKQIAWLERAT